MMEQCLRELAKMQSIIRSINDQLAELSLILSPWSAEPGEERK
jgi:hypothetical protein